MVNVLMVIVVMVGLIFAFIAVWRMMKAQEELAAAVKEIGLQLKENAAIQEQGKKEHQN